MNFLDKKFCASWIWCDPEKFPDYQKSRHSVYCRGTDNYKYGVFSFKKTFFVSKDVMSAYVYVSGDARYTLYINGEIVSYGPPAVGGDYGIREPLDYYFADRVEINFAKGNNEIFADVSLQPEAASDISMGHGGFFLEGHVLYRDGTEDIISTDETWLCGLNRAYDAVDSYRGTLDKTEFFPAVKTENLWRFAKKDIPNMRLVKKRFCDCIVPYEESKGRVCIKDGKVMLKPGAPLHFLLDFGRIYSAYIDLDIKTHEKIFIKVQNQELPGQGVRAVNILAKSGETKYRSTKIYSARYLEVSVQGPEFPVELDITLTSSCYPSEHLGTFACSDKRLNDIYNMCIMTAQICRQTYHMDSPTHQEPTGCTGDYFIVSLINYYAFGGKRLTRLDILRTAAVIEKFRGVMFHTSYSLIWTEMVRDYVLYTGDFSVYGEILPALEILLERFCGYIGESGVIENTPNYMFMDWVERDGFNLHHPPKVVGQCYMSVLLYRAFVNGAHIFGFSGETAKAEKYSFAASALKRAINGYLWDESRGLYIDGKNNEKYAPSAWLPYGEGRFYSQHANSLAVLYDVAPKERAADIMENVMNDEELFKAEPYFMHFVFEALKKAGLFEKYAMGQLMRWYRLYNECSTGLRECWYKKGDYSHAWSGTPAYQMYSGILGVVPVDSGFKRVKIQPQLCGLEWASGSVPTPYGIIKVRCDKNGVHYEVPDGITVCK